jgi:hypothetical protein
MLTELHGKGGTFCEPARQGRLRCPLLVRSTSEDVITGHLVQALRAINPRWWLPDLLNESLGTERFHRQIFRRFRIEPWINQQRIPRELLPWKEGSTQVDVGIFWENQPTTVFIEAKYQSDLSLATANSDQQSQFPADQLIRNIRVGLHACGYFQSNHLFEIKPRDFVVILLTPDGRHPLVDEYRDTTRLLKAIPNSDQLKTLPQTPFIGQITYRQIEGVLRKQRRWFTRSEQIIADTLIDYLEFKRGRCNGVKHSAIQSEIKWRQRNGDGTNGRDGS